MNQPAPNPTGNRAYLGPLLATMVATLALFLPWGALYVEPIEVDLGGFARAFGATDIDLPKVSVTPDVTFNVLEGYVEPFAGLELQNWFTLVAAVLCVVFAVAGLSGRFSTAWPIMAAAGYGAYHTGFLVYVAILNDSVHLGPAPVLGFLAFCLAIVAALRLRKTPAAGSRQACR